MRLLDMISPSWHNSAELAEILRVEGLLIERLQAARDLLIAQLRIETATIGLPAWERALGIPTDVTLSLGLRRSKCKAKLQGLGITTAEVLCAIVQRFTGGVATLQEGVAKHTSRITVEGVLNPPEDMAAMRHSVVEVKPAHLAIEYALRYQSGRLPIGCGMAVQEVKRYHFGLEVST